MERNRGTNRPRNAPGSRNRNQPSNEDSSNFTGILPRHSRNTRGGSVQDSTVSSQTGAEFDTNTTRQNIPQSSRTNSNGESGNELQIRFRNQRQIASSSTPPSSSTTAFRSRGGDTASTATSRNATRAQGRHPHGSINTNRNSSVRAGVSPKRNSTGSSPRRGERRAGAVNVIPPSLRYRGNSRVEEENNLGHDDDHFDFTSLEPHFYDFYDFTETNSPLGSYLAARGPRGLVGFGTEDHPFELLNDSTSGLDARPNAADPVPESESDDAALALRLQQEEWARASTPHSQQDPRNLPGSPDRMMSVIQNALRSHSRGEPVFISADAARRALQNNRAQRSAMAQVPQDVMQMLFGMPPVVGAIDDTDDSDDSYEALLDMEEQVGNVLRGLTQSVIDRIPVIKHTSTVSTAKGACAFPEEEFAQCPVCLSEYEDGEEKRMLPCKHELHKICIDTWLKNNTTCPVCRKDVRDVL